MADDEQAGSVPPPPPPPPPPELAPAPVEVAVVRRGRARWAIGSVALLALVVGAIVVLARGDDPDADAALAAAQAVVEESSSFRFEIKQTRRVVIGDADRAGSDTTVRTFTEGTVAGEDRWHRLTEQGAPFGFPVSPWEEIRIGSDHYVAGDLFSEPVEGVDAPRWTRSEAVDEVPDLEDLAAEVEMFADEEWWPGDQDDSLLAEAKLDLAVGAYLLGLDGGPPQAVTRVVLDAAQPAVEERLADGGLRLRARLEPVERIEEASGLELPPVDLLLDLDGQDRPTLARFTAQVAGASADVELRFADWGADLTVDPPEPSDIDQTPWLAEEALATVPDLLVLPSTLPEGLALVSGSVQLYEGPDCPSVDLFFGTEADHAIDPMEIDWNDDDWDADWPLGPSLHLSVSPASCADEYDDSSFDEALGGLPAREDYGWEVLLGDAWVMVDTDLEGDELDALVASLQVVPLESLAAAIPAWAQVESALWW